MAAPKDLPFIIFFGQEDYFLDKAIETARAWKNRSIVQLEGDGLADHQLVSACEAQSFDGTPRVVIVDNAQDIKGTKYLASYIEGKSVSETSVILVAIIRAEKMPEVWSATKGKASVAEYKKMKTWDNKNEVVQWIGDRITNKNARRSHDPGLPLLLFQRVGHDLHKLASEIRKLFLLVPPGGVIKASHIELIVADSYVSDPFQVADATMEKDVRRALIALSTLYRSESDETRVNLPVSAALIKSVERTFVGRKILDRGGNAEDVATRLSMHPWRCKEHFIPIVKKHTAGDLIRHMGRLCRLDADIKGPTRSKRTLVELTIHSIAAGG